MQGKLTRTQSMQQLMDMVNKLAHCTTEPGRSTSPAAEVMLAWVDDDGPIKQGGATATEELLLEVVCKLSARDKSRCLHIRCLVRGEVLLQPLAGVVASDIKGGRGPSLEWTGRFAWLTMEVFCHCGQIEVERMRMVHEMTRRSGHCPIQDERGQRVVVGVESLC
jgi:hypothetical protein